MGRNSGNCRKWQKIFIQYHCWVDKVSRKWKYILNEIFFKFFSEKSKTTFRLCWIGCYWSLMLFLETCCKESYVLLNNIVCKLLIYSSTRIFHRPSHSNCIYHPIAGKQYLSPPIWNAELASSSSLVVKFSDKWSCHAVWGNLASQSSPVSGS